MTKEEAIHVINQVRDIITKSPSWMEEATRVVNEAAEIAIKALEAQEWIPCSERLPEALQEVIVTSTAGYVYTSRIVHGDFEYGGNVIAWMPLPSAYREEGD